MNTVINMYQQIQNIVEKVARASETSLFATSSAKKSLNNVKDNPRALAEDETDVLSDIEQAEQMIHDLEEVIVNWIIRNDLGDALKVPIR